MLVGSSNFRIQCVSKMLGVIKLRNCRCRQSAICGALCKVHQTADYLYLKNIDQNDTDIKTMIEILFSILIEFLRTTFYANRVINRIHNI